MKIVKELEWLRDYITSVSHLLPRIKQLKKISLRRGSREYFQHFHGLITYFDKKSFRITLYITYHDSIKDDIVNYSTIDMLEYLAHELAHLEHWDHTTSHKQLQCIILGIFMTKLAEAGYVSEEAESKDGKFYPRPEE
jgi:hypothetical protein